jgi:hypothetical protein
MKDTSLEIILKDEESSEAVNIILPPNEAEYSWIIRAQNNGGNFDVLFIKSNLDNPESSVAWHVARYNHQRQEQWPRSYLSEMFSADKVKSVYLVDEGVQENPGRFARYSVTNNSGQKIKVTYLLPERTIGVDLCATLSLEIEHSSGSIWVPDKLTQDSETRKWTRSGTSPEQETYSESLEFERPDSKILTISNLMDSF